MVFRQEDNSWFCIVDYYDDANPAARIPRTFTWPIDVDLNAARNEVIAKGEEVKNIASINTEQIVGLKIPLP